MNSYTVFFDSEGGQLYRVSVTAGSFEEALEIARTYRAQQGLHTEVHSARRDR